MDKYKALYDDSYFLGRNSNDLKRLKSFHLEKDLLKKHVNFKGKVCDIGCSTGEFLKEISWEGERYGMEISEKAKKIAEKTGINFEKNITNVKEYFDLVVFRGTIQHLPEPIRYIQFAYDSLKPGGTIAFLATPNSNSIVYKLKNTLPVLVPQLNFYIPSDLTLINISNNIGFQMTENQKPYLKSPYKNFLADHFNFLKMIIFRTKPNFSFWGNMMNLIFIKPNV
jgi:SAM-dependent methyltransferase